ncbi:pyruvate kinase [Candidatus Paraluminiphilus aquimaris]|uniref:Pyruvate kinase n=1 Tax=Candidatus Paraluminiphilus aquimaris TaxID=2518994 RepID=A0ABY6Q313_9GAMM|nr:pyruvate kinase [Candidatus Paraluminiphilus aquimaris]UZP73609.1 pyruvate kinase [Candidatus Paraluminiphilus aquimaris]
MPKDTTRVHRRTKIVATVGPGSDSEDMISRLIAAGVDVFRLNFSHGLADNHQRVASRIRKQARHHNRYVGVLADLQGPKIRIAGFREGFVRLTAGDSFDLCLDRGSDEGDSSCVGIEYKDLPNSVEVDDILLLDDGKMRLRVDSVSATTISCTVVIGGKLSSRKGVNKLGGGIAAPALTEKDKNDIKSMESIQPDFVAVSFVASVGDIEEARSLLNEVGVNAGIIAKIERAEVVAESGLLDDIIDACEGVMVARGDLGIEVGDAQLIGIQKDLISRTRKRDRMVITATQMMESMIENSMPTRAEVFDVANAVLDGTDAVMLSAETAVGSYPVEVVRSMASAALGAERHPVARTSRYRQDREFRSPQETIALSAMYGANHFPGVAGIASHTETGSTAMLMSRLSSGLPIFALSRNPETLQRLALCRGVIPLYFDVSAFDSRDVEARTMEFLNDAGFISKGDFILMTNGTRVGQAGGTDSIKLLSVG